MKRLVFLWVVAALGLWSCKEEESVHDVRFSLVKGFVEDTILYKRVSFKIRVKNDGRQAVFLTFKREKDLLSSQGPTESSEKNTGVFMLDPMGNKVEELLLYSLYPQEIIVKSHGQVDLSFVCSTDKPIYPMDNGLQNKNELKDSITAFIKAHTIAFYRTTGPKNTPDTIILRMGKDLDIGYGPVYLGN